MRLAGRKTVAQLQQFPTVEAVHFFVWGGIAPRAQRFVTYTDSSSSLGGDREPQCLGELGVPGEQ